ncbi:hypothetical protein GUITHDRAFT_165666 [Guillardia theta CCMP2712]|uniref:Uncharacterized protein n=1 Tax=Guillardia theta (strain CCMP2712) TaxID=905079 RepID=L1ILJ6_GUITC|nr:hypothetical protein GUITHDRAFT_165666 [Guillardia theta CCMP2712]EKX36670.1 hypothetical protein GUITHDRAFT_165666 [Guillardia theta CCMP2712]|eukprot:XP_005823650.1 hypothetical protein GUITHDRAFT_165666 [Guillardia theta CCMP2712]
MAAGKKMMLVDSSAQQQGHHRGRRLVPARGSKDLCSVVASAFIFLLFFISSDGEPFNVDQEEIPDAVLESLSAQHPAMRELLQASTVMPETSSLGTSNYTCVARHEYIAMATDPYLSAASNQYTDGTFFCDGYVDYAAACDLARPNKSCNNKYAKKIYSNLVRALDVYSCKSYSNIWTCSDCKAAFKRWLCSQIYKKFVIPDTTLFEEGNVSLPSYACTCPWPPLNQTAEQTAKDFASKPYCLLICAGLPRNCTAPPGQAVPSCPTPACGAKGTADDPGRCTASVYLDSQSASSFDDFYVGSKVEITSTNMKGYWMLIDKYDGFSKLAMGTQWNAPYGTTMPNPPPVPAQGNTYRIYLTKKQQGFCRSTVDPSKRLGPPCEQMQQFLPDQTISTGWPAIPYLMVNGVKTCLDGSPFTATGCGSPATAQIPPKYYSYPMPGLSYGGIRSGYYLKNLGNAQNWMAYHLAAGTGTLNYSCVGLSGSTLSEAIVATKKNVTVPATLAVPASKESGCTTDFLPISDKAQDDCALKTCNAVCLDVSRRCPYALEFRCPSLGDYREYDFTECNMMVPHGCMIQVQEVSGSIKCSSLNPQGYGPEDTNPLGGKEQNRLLFNGIFGLPPSPNCSGLNGLSIDAGIGPSTGLPVNPPINGPASKKNSTFPYDIWCKGASDSTLALSAADVGCRVIMYKGQFEQNCYVQGA